MVQGLRNHSSSLKNMLMVITWSTMGDKRLMPFTVAGKLAGWLPTRWLLMACCSMASYSMVAKGLLLDGWLAVAAAGWLAVAAGWIAAAGWLGVARWIACCCSIDGLLLQDGLLLEA